MNISRITSLLLMLLLAVVLTAFGQTTTIRGETSLLASPGEIGVVLDILSPGMSVEVLTVEGSWARIRIPATSEVGWVNTGSLARDVGTAGTLGRDGMTDTELSRVRGRVQMMSSGMENIEQRVDSLLLMLGDGAEPETPMVARMDQAPETMTENTTMPMAYAGFMLDGGPYRWSNQFVMGTYLRGGQSYYGLNLCCALESRGRNVLVARGQYGLGEQRGNIDDFVDWTVGMDFNLFPETYVVYPYFGAHFGMRHMFESDPEGSDFLIAVPTVGVRADLGRVFTLGAELRGLFRFENGERRDDGMVGFTAGYRW